MTATFAVCYECSQIEHWFLRHIFLRLKERREPVVQTRLAPCPHTAYHIVFAPKYRRRAFARNDIERCLRRLIEGIARREGMRVHALEVMPDHVHLFAEVPPRLSVARVMQTLKGKTAYELFRVFPELRSMFRGGHLWSRGKFFRSVGEVTGDVIEHYILESQGRPGRPRPSIRRAPPEASPKVDVQSSPDAFAD